MTEKEKILLIELILRDIRLNWTEPKARVMKARELCLEVGGDDFKHLAKVCEEYMKDCGDGRFFRDTFPEGYEDMNAIHGLKSTFLDKSEEFKQAAEMILSCPEHAFTDWEEKEELEYMQRLQEIGDLS